MFSMTVSSKINNTFKTNRTRSKKYIITKSFNN